MVLCGSSVSVRNPGGLQVQCKYPDRQIGTSAVLHKSASMAWFIFTFNPEEFLSDVLTSISHVLLEPTYSLLPAHVGPELSLPPRAAI